MTVFPRARRAWAVAAGLALALILPSAAQAGTLRQPVAPGTVANQSAAVDTNDGSLLLVWSIENTSGPDPIRFCRIPVGSSTCAVSVAVGTPTTDSLPRIAQIAASSTYRVVAVASGRVESWLSTTNGGATWGSTTVASASPNLSSVNVASKPVIPADGNIYIRTDSAVLRLAASSGLGYSSVLLPFSAGTEASNQPAIVPTSNGLVAAATRYALTPNGVTTHALPTGGTFTTPSQWAETFTPRSGLLYGGSPLAGPSEVGIPAVLATPTSDGGAPTIRLTPYASTTPGAESTLPGGPFTTDEPDDWVRAASGRTGNTRSVVWVGRKTGLERIRYATSTAGGAFSPASALYSTAVPDLSSYSLDAVTDDANHGYLTWVQSGGPRFVDLTPVPDPAGPGGGGGTGGGGTTKPKAKNPADPGTSVAVPGGRLRLTIKGTRIVTNKKTKKKKRCLVSKKRVKMVVTLTRRAKPKIRRVKFQLNGKTKGIDRRKPFAKKVKVVRVKRKRSARFRAITVLRQGKKTTKKRLSKKVSFCT